LALALIGYNNTIPLTNKIAVYVPSTGASSTTWTDLYSSGYNFNVSSTMPYVGNYFSKISSATNADLSLKANFGAAVATTIKTIVVVMNWGTAGAADFTIVNDPATGSKFISHRVGGSFLTTGSNGPGGVVIYHNGVNVTSGFTNDFWSNKWHTVVITNMDCSAYTGLEICAYTGFPSYAIAVGGKVAAVALFNANFSAADVAKATAWGQAFYRV
jgi:hypothetical protein